MIQQIIRVITGCLLMGGSVLVIYLLWTELYAGSWKDRGEKVGAITTTGISVFLIFIGIIILIGRLGP